MKCWIGALAASIALLSAPVLFTKPLDQRNHLRRRATLVHQPPDPERGLEAERDPGLHVGELLLEELGLSKRPSELLAIEAILTGGEPTILCRAHRAPGYAVARAVQAAEWPF